MDDEAWGWLSLIGIPALISSIPLTVARWSWSKMKQKMRDMRATELGLQALLRDRLVQAYNHSVHGRGFCPIYEKENITGMYEQYHNLGGNGAVKKLYDEMMDLPTQLKEEK